MTLRSTKLLICDVDGTLVRDDKSLSPATRTAVARLRKAGIAVALISARPPSGMLWLIEALGLDGPSCGFGGGTTFSPEGSVLDSVRIEPDAARAMIAMLDAEAIESWIFADDAWYARSDANPHVARERLSAGIDPTICDDLASVCGNADKIVGVSDDAPLMERVETRLRDRLDGRGTLVLSQPYYLDLTASRANKGNGIATIARMLDIALGDVTVIGDMPNDIAMFERAGFAVAMGQAPDAVRAAADMVTESNEADGVVCVIDHILAER